MTMGLVQAFFICAAFGLFIGKAHGSGSSLHVLAKSPGQSVLFNTSWDPAVPYTYLTWEMSSSLHSPPITLLTANGSSSVNILPVYKDRALTLFPDGSLELYNLTFSDSGFYRVNITSKTIAASNFYELYVQEPVSDVRISTSTTDVVEGYPVFFKCSASGTSPNYIFYYGNQTLDSVSDEADLPALKRNATGPYRCEAYNLINRVTSSNEINLTINYGPDDVFLNAIPLEYVYSVGSNVTLQCLVTGSKPAAEITWSWSQYFAFKLLPFNGSEIHLGPLTYEDRGTYQCKAYNKRTLQSEIGSFYVNVANDAGMVIASRTVVFGSGVIVFYLMNRTN